MVSLQKQHLHLSKQNITLLKQNMGEEMTEQMSDEITKAMDEQRALEQRYA